MRLFPTVAVLVVLALAVPSSANDCTAWTTSSADVDTVVEPGVSPTGGSGRYYVDDDHCHFCIISMWVYEESNGRPGLQRGDEVVDDTCHRMIAPDTVIL